MGKISKLVTTIRNNWKKSAVAAVALSYGVQYGKGKYDTHQLMRYYCEKASEYGNQPHPVLKPFRKITVILNPAANKRKSKTLFDKYCAPLLHLAGISVTVVQTEYAGQPKELLESLDPNTDAIVIAGGDGTLSETVTGLLRRAGDNLSTVKNLPIGVLPLGQTSLIGKTLFSETNMVKSLIDATMTVIQGTTEIVDVIQVQPVKKEDEEEEPSKAIYSLGQLEWGSFRDANTNQDKYWYFGPLRKYLTYVFTSVQTYGWQCNYTEPCSGCQTCHQQKIQTQKNNRKWWNIFINTKTKPEKDYSNIINENCGNVKTKQFTTYDLKVCTKTLLKNKKDVEDKSELLLQVGRDDITWSQFIREGWSRVKSNVSPEPCQQIPVQCVELIPTNEIKDGWLSIDSEEFEVRPVKLTIVPKTVSLFVPVTV